MKKLNILFVLACTMLLAASCGKKVNVAFPTSTVNVAAEGGEVVTSLTSNGDWTVDSHPEWLTVSPMHGSGDAPLTLIVSANNDQEARTGEVKVSSKDNTATLTVMQEFVETYLRVTPDAYLIDCYGGSFEIEVESNVAWTLSGLTEWVSASVTEGSNNGRILVEVAPIVGEVTEGRLATLAIASGDLKAFVVVNQTHESWLAFSVTPHELEFPYEGGTGTLSVSSNIPWTTFTKVDWITVSPDSGDGYAEVTVNVAENPEFVGREENIKFTYTFPDSSTGFVLVRVRQAAAPDPHFLTVSPQEFSFDKNGGTAEITVECDVDWTADLQSDWASLSTNSGTGNATVTLTVAPNNVTDPRSLDFWIASGNLKRNVLVSQAAGDMPPVVELSPDTLYAPHIGGVASLNVTANVPWSIETSAPWIIMWNHNGNGNGTQDFVVDVNSSSLPRTAEVVARYNGQIMDRTIVVQEAKPIILEVDITEINAPLDGGQYTIKVTSNLNWRVERGEYWLKYYPASGTGDGEFVIIVEPLTSIHDRETEIYVVGDYDTQVIIRVSQRH